MSDYKVHVSTFNDELLIKKCLAPLTQVFDVTVHDFGSTDTTAEIAKTFPITYVNVGKLNPVDYTAYKSDVKHGKTVFWVDSDEEYPVTELLRLKPVLEDPEMIWVAGYWIFLFPDTSKLSNLAYRGRIVWPPARMKLYRAWPREHLDDNFITKEETKREIQRSDDLKIWCYHHVLMKRSNTPEDPARAEKRAKRLIEARQYLS